MNVLLYLIPSILMVASLVTIVVIYAHKFSLAASLDLQAMKEYRERVRKTALIEDRLARKLAVAKKRFLDIVLPISQWLVTFAKNFFHWLKSVEERYHQTAQQTTVVDSATQQQSISGLLEQAQGLIQEEQYAEAEKKYIAAIAMDHASVPAYRGLASLYMVMKDYPHALETLNFLEQLDPNDETTWQDLGLLYKEQNQFEDALEAYEQALVLGPNNPKNLDACIELAISNKLKYKAQNYLEKLQKVNPENKKLETYKERIAQL